MSLKGVVALTSRSTVAKLDSSDEDVDFAAIKLDVDSETGLGMYGAQKAEDTTSVTIGSWVRVGYTWDVTNGKHKFVFGSTNWSDGEEDVEALTAPSGNFIYFALSGQAVNNACNRETYIDNVYFINGTYEASDPKP